MTYTSHIRQRTARFLLVLWGLICLSNVVFRHTHRLPDGRIITHAHPYAGFTAKCPFPNHQHTRSELAWLDCLSHTPFETPTPGISCPLPAVWLAPRLTYAYLTTEGETYRFFHFLRGPPVLRG